MSVFARDNRLDPTVARGPVPVSDLLAGAARAPGVSLGWLAGTLLTLALVYLSMLNPYWVPSGDGEVYTCIARSLVQGEGLTFNGQRAAIAPPGWPVVLSLAMRISPEFLFLKLVITGFMLASFVPAFYILRRYVTDRAAAGILLLTGTLSSLYPLTFWTHTEAFFCLLGFTAILIAFRINEGRARLWLEVPIMLFLLGFGAFTRWPGVLHLVLVIPILLSGPRRPWRDWRAWALVAAVVIASVGTFKATYNYLSLTPEQQRLAVAAGGTNESEGGELEQPVMVPTGPTQPNLPEASTPGGADIGGVTDRGPVAEVAYRISVAGKWFAWLLWQPTRFGQSVGAINASALASGWLTICLLAVALLRRLHVRDYFWVGLAAYTGGLCVVWPNPNARYFVPVAPFIILGVFLGIRALRDFGRGLPWRRGTEDDEASTGAWASRSSDDAQPPSPPRDPARRIARIAAPVLAGLFVLVTLVSNLSLLAIDISVFRSDDFYGRYEAGANKELIMASQLIKATPHAGRIAVSERYDNMGRTRYSNFAKRALHLLCNEVVIGLPRNRLSNRPTYDPTRRWLKKEMNNADYYVYQSTWTPWRVWHFRLSPEMQQRITGRQVGEPSGGWELYVRREVQYRRVELPQRIQPPRRVPGL